MPGDIYSLIESANAGSKEDRRTLDIMMADQLGMLNTSSGNSMLAPTNGAQKTSAPPPQQGSIAVSAANGTFVVIITPATETISGPVYQEVSYSPVKNFGAQITTLPLSTDTHYTIPYPGATLFIRFRSTRDKVNFNNYVLASQSAMAAGLQSSAASENNTPLNQSNYALVDSVDAGATANVRVYGVAGPYNGFTAVKGAIESGLPSATIVNVPHGSTQIVSYDGDQYQVKSTLPGVFPDNWTPVGQVSVVGSGSPTLPVITPLLNAGHLYGATFTPGSGLTEPPVLTVTDTGGGTGAIIIAIISGGAMTGYQIQAAGEDYTVATVITATGGVFAGVTGGGTASGGNGGRLTKI